MSKIIFFDLDGTLINNPSSEKRFFFWLLIHGYLKPKQIFLALVFFFRWLSKYQTQIFVKNKAWLSDLKIAEIAVLAENFTKEKLFGCIRPHVKQILEQHLANGDYVILMTGTLEYIAKIFAKYFAVSEVCHSICANNGKVFLNMPMIQHPYGIEKLILAEKICKQHKVEIKNTVAYGNSIHDLALLEKVGEAIAVTPDKALRKIALQRNWQIVENK